MGAISHLLLKHSKLVCSPQSGRLNLLNTVCDPKSDFNILYCGNMKNNTIEYFGMKLFQCEVIHMQQETMHKHKQALALQAFSHAKGHYLAAVRSNRSIAGWETDPGSVPSLRGCTIWQLQHICVFAVCAHSCTSVGMFMCQKNWCIRPPLR